MFLGARERGVIVRPLAKGLAVSPPLTITQEHIDEIVATLRATLDAVASSYSGRRASTSAAISSTRPPLAA